MMYALVWSCVQVDTDSDGYIGGAEGAAFIRRARLLNDANREVCWLYLLPL